MNLLKLTSLKKPKDYFDACHFGVLFDQKTQFEKP